MSFVAESGRILVRDANSDLVFDTEERNIVWTNELRGSLTLPERTATASSGSHSDVNEDDDTVLTSVNSAATFVFGGMIASASGSSPFYGGWRSVTGSYLTGYAFLNNTGTTDGSGKLLPPWSNVGGIRTGTFRISGGNLIFTDRVWLRAAVRGDGALRTSTFVEADVDFHLLCGAFV